MKELAKQYGENYMPELKQLAKLYGETLHGAQKEVRGESMEIKGDQMLITYTYLVSRGNLNDLKELFFDVPEDALFQTANEMWRRCKWMLYINEYEDWLTDYVELFNADLLSFTIDLMLDYKQKALNHQWENSMT